MSLLTDLFIYDIALFIHIAQQGECLNRSFHGERVIPGPAFLVDHLAVLVWLQKFFQGLKFHDRVM